MKNLTNDQIVKNRQLFIQLCKENIHRDGLDKLLDRLQESDFFIAPCSSKYHLNFRGGLCQHSLNVYQMLLELCSMLNVKVSQNLETLTIVALFHDYCKADFYKSEMKSMKEGNQWITKSVFVIDDQLPLGHGEKSLYLISRCIDLTSEEACAIRWHMGAYDNAMKGGEQAFNSACERFELVTLLHTADLLSSRCLEK